MNNLEKIMIIIFVKKEPTSGFLKILEWNNVEEQVH